MIVEPSSADPGTPVPANRPVDEIVVSGVLRNPSRKNCLNLLDAERPDSGWGATWSRLW
jgi:hypothetical protein